MISCWKYGAKSRFCRLGSAWYAEAISLRKAERMIQPLRQIRAMDARFSSHPRAFDASERRGEALGVGDDLRCVEALLKSIDVALTEAGLLVACEGA